MFVLRYVALLCALPIPHVILAVEFSHLVSNYELDRLVIFKIIRSGVGMQHLYEFKVKILFLLEVA